MATHKKILILLFTCLFFYPFFCEAESYKDWQAYKDYLKLPDEYKSPAMEKSYKDSYDAQQKVKNLPCINGGTIQEYLDKKAAIPAVEDLGWATSPYNGGFEVERILILNGMKLIYRWSVLPDGSIVPANGKAQGLTK